MAKIAPHAEVGRIGEDIAARYLETKGYGVLDRNYRKKWGELDIIAIKGGILHFVEVKTVSRGTGYAVSRETSGYRAEENVHLEKLKRLHRAIESYLIQSRREEQAWQIDVLGVTLNPVTMEAECSFIQNVF